MKLHDKVLRQSIMTVPWYQKGSSEFIPVPILGPDIFDPRQIQLIKEHTMANVKTAAKAAPVAAKPVAAAPAATPAAPAPAAEGAPAAMSDKAKERIEQAKARLAAKRQSG
jgi:hypothetical protein